MQNVNKNAVKATVATKQVVAVQQDATHPVITAAQRRLYARVQAVQAKRAAKNAARKQAANQQAYLLQAAQLAAQYGMPAPVFNPVAVIAAARQPRANSATIAPSNAMVEVNGVYYKPCKAVHAIAESFGAEATRKEVLEACRDKGINKATASTQYGIYRAAVIKAAAEAAKAAH